MIDQGVAEGAQPVLDGRHASIDGYGEGSFVGPTILDGVTSEMTVAKDEIFGPVLSIMHLPDFNSAVDAHQQEPLRQRRQPVHRQRQTRPRVQVPRARRQHRNNVGVAAATASFPFGGQKNSFFGDLHGQGPDRD